jgi:chemotaxis protein MotB
MEFEELEELPQLWQLSLADMSMLLMCFFIFLFSLSSMGAQNVTDTLESVRKRLHADTPMDMKRPDGGVVQADRAQEQFRVRQETIRRQNQVAEDLRRHLVNLGMEGTVKVAVSQTRLVITLQTDGMFTPGESQLTDQGQARMLMLRDFLSRYSDERINIKGFSDDLPPPDGSRFKDNWELTSIRAVSALRFLIAKGVPANRLTATGLADLEPVFPNTSADNRSRNRRLEFVLEVWSTQ